MQQTVYCLWLYWKDTVRYWCVFVTINWINRSFKWILGTDRQQHMNWTAFWWQSQRAHDRRSRPNLCRSRRKLSITRPIVRQNFASRIQLWNGKCCSFLNKNLILAFILCAKIYKEPQIINHKFYSLLFIPFSCGCHILIFIIMCHDLLKFSPRERTQTRLHSNWSISRMFTASMVKSNITPHIDWF